MLKNWMRRDGQPKALWQDFLASIVVFLVALPLCLGIAIASGAPPALGLITGIIGGLVVGAIAGCPLQVSGPAAGLVAIVWEAINRFGLENLGLIVLFAGLVQIAAGWFRYGNWFRAVSPAVIQGMLAGIGVLILASQFHVMMDDVPQESGIKNLLTIPEALYKGIFPLDGSTHHMAAAIGAMTILIIMLWNHLPGRFRLVPAPLVAVICAVVAAYMMQLPINYVSVPDNILEVVQPPQFLGNAIFLDGAFWLAVITFAFIASAETMLTATAVDQMQNGPRTRYNKEMLAQGVGNTLCGLLGALPMTGVIVRSGANVQAGAKTRRSTIFHSTWILLTVMFAPALLNLVPISSLAAILVYTGYKLVNPATIRALKAYGNSEVVIYFITMSAIIMTNLLEGVIIGFVLSAFRLLYNFSKLEGQVLTDPKTPNQVTLYLRGRATFLSLPRLAAILDSVPPGLSVDFRTDALEFVDHACLNHLRNWERQYQLSGGKLSVEWNTLAARYRGEPVHEPDKPLARTAP